jgi:hypothetical protein
MAVYKTMKDLGVGKEERVLRAIDLFDATANSKLINSVSPWFYFARSKGQGGANLTRSLFMSGKAGPAVLAAKVAFHSMVTLPAVAALMGKGDDGEDLIDTMNMSTLGAGIPLPTYMLGGDDDGSTITLPFIGFGMDTVAWKSAIALRRMAVNEMSTTEALGVGLRSMFDSTSPVDIAGGDVWKNNPIGAFAWSITPSIAKPFAEAGSNTNAFGQPIVKTRQQADKRRAESGGDLTPDFYKDSANMLYALTGGAVDVFPEQVQYMVNSYAVGPLSLVKAATADRGEKTGGAKITEAEEIGMVAQALGYGRIYNSGSANSSSRQYQLISRKNDILKDYNIETSDPKNVGNPGRKGAMIRAQLVEKGAPVEDIDFVTRTLQAEKDMRTGSKKTREAARSLWSNGQEATDNAPELQRLYEQEDKMRDAYLKDVSDEDSDN